MTLLAARSSSGSELPPGSRSRAVGRGAAVPAGRGARGSRSGNRGTGRTRSGPRATDLLPQVEHIIIYMQENHSYDSYFGLFDRGDGYCIRNGVPTNSNLDLEGRRVPVAARALDVPARPGRVAELDLQPPADRRRPHGRLPLRRQPQRHALLGPHGPAVLLLARRHVPAVRPVVRVRPRADVPEPHVPPGRRRRRAWSAPTPRRRSRSRIPPAARSGTSSTRTGSRGTTTRGTSPTSRSSRRRSVRTRTRSGRSSSSSATVRPVHCRPSRS